MRDLISHLNDEGVTIDVNDSDSPNRGADLNTTQIQNMEAIISEDGLPLNIPLGIEGIEKVEIVDVISEISEPSSLAIESLAGEREVQNVKISNMSSDMPLSINQSINTVDAKVKAVSDLDDTENILPLINITSKALKGQASEYIDALDTRISILSTSQNALPSSQDTAKEPSTSSLGENFDVELSNVDKNKTYTSTASDAAPDTSLDNIEDREVGEEKLDSNVKAVSMLESDSNILWIDVKSEIIDTSVETSHFIRSEGPLPCSTSDSTSDSTSASNLMGTSSNDSSDLGSYETTQNNFVDTEKDVTLPFPTLPTPIISNISAGNNPTNSRTKEETFIAGSQYEKTVSTNVSVPVAEVNFVSNSTENHTSVLETVIVDSMTDLGPKNHSNSAIIGTSISENNTDIKIREEEILINPSVDESSQSIVNSTLKTIKTPVREGFQHKVEEEEEEEEEGEVPSPTSFPVFTDPSYHPAFPSSTLSSDGQQADMIDDSMDDKLSTTSFPVAAVTATPVPLLLSLSVDADLDPIIPDAYADIAVESPAVSSITVNSSISKDEIQSFEVTAMTSESITSTSAPTLLNTSIPSSPTTSTSLAPTTTTSSSSVITVSSLPIEATLPVVSTLPVVLQTVPSLPSASVTEIHTSTASVTSTSTSTAAEASVSISSSSIPIPVPVPKGLVRVVNVPSAGLSPSCLETLRFSDFQASMAKKLKLKADSDKTQVPQSSQDNVFRLLMSKIKTLEMNYAIIEMYSAQVKCHNSFRFLIFNFFIFFHFMIHINIFFHQFSIVDFSIIRLRIRKFYFLTIASPLNVFFHLLFFTFLLLSHFHFF